LLPRGQKGSKNHFTAESGSHIGSLGLYITEHSGDEPELINFP